MNRCVTIKSVTVEAMRFIFFGWVLRDLPCGKSIAAHKNISCGSQNQYGKIHKIKFAHESGSNPNFVTDPHIRSIPFVIECGFDTLGLQTIRPFLQVREQKNFYVDPCTINMCTKLYGSGGAFSNDKYVRKWMKHMKSTVDMITIYILDSMVPSYTISLLKNYSNVNLVLWNSSFTTNEYRMQSESAASEIEGIYRSAIDHCAIKSVSRFGWVLVMDLDETLHIRNKKRLCKLQHANHMISFPTLQWMSNNTLCPHMSNMAMKASSDRDTRLRIEERSQYFRNAWRWKGMLTPRMKAYYFAAHIKGVLTPPDVAFLTHRNYEASCQDQCCCHNSPCT